MFLQARTAQRSNDVFHRRATRAFDQNSGLSVLLGAQRSDQVGLIGKMARMLAERADGVGHQRTNGIKR